MGESLIISNNPRLDIALGAARPWLVAVALTTLPAELIGHTTESEFTAADIERAALPGSFGVLPALGFRIAVAPALVIG